MARARNRYDEHHSGRGVLVDRHIRGHSGDLYNDAVDEVARVCTRVKGILTWTMHPWPSEVCVESNGEEANVGSGTQAQETEVRTLDNSALVAQNDGSSDGAGTVYSDFALGSEAEAELGMCSDDPESAGDPSGEDLSDCQGGEGYDAGTGE